MKIDEKSRDMALWIKSRQGALDLMHDGKEYARAPQAVVDEVKGKLEEINTIDSVGMPLKAGDKARYHAVR